MRGRKREWAYRDEKGNYALVPCTSLRHKEGQRVFLRSWRSLPPPPWRIKSYTIPIFPGSVCISRLCLWKPERLPRCRVFMKRKRTKKTGVHARVYTCSKFVPFGAFAKKWYEEWSNYATYCTTATLLSATHMLAYRKKLSHRRRENCFDYRNIFFAPFSFLFSLHKNDRQSHRVCLILP